MKKIFILLLLVAGVVSCTDPKSEDPFRISEMDPIAMGLDAYPEYSTYVEMLHKTDIYNALNLSNYSFTVFVVSNDNIQKYLDTKLWVGATIDDMTDVEMKYLMQYHIISGASYVASDLYLQITTPTVTGKYLTAGIDQDTGSRYISNGETVNASNIIARDIEFTNGYVHELDNVLQPIESSIWDIISTNSDYNVFSDLITLCGLEDFFSRSEVEIDGVMVAEEKTLLMVTDYAFYEDEAITEVGQLLDLIDPDCVEPTDPNSDIHQWLLYHVLINAVGYEKMTTFPSSLDDGLFPDDAHNLKTLAGFSLLSIADVDNTIYLNPHDNVNGNIIFNDSRRDIPTSNGYVHEISGMLNFPTSIGSYPLIWDPVTTELEFRTLTDYGYVNRTDLAARGDTLDYSGQIPTITWTTIPETAATVYYYNTGNSDHDDGDAILFYLGVNGTITFEIPALPIGSVEVYIVRGPEYNEGGYFNMLLDGANFSSAVSFLSDEDDEDSFYDYYLSGTLTTTEETLHTLSFETNSNGYGVGGFDVIVFKPI